MKYHIHTRCRNPRATIVLRASVAEVSFFTHIGFLVIIVATVVVLASKPSPTTRKAKSLAVNIPDKCSSLSITSTQSARLAAISCDASTTKALSLTVNACDGLSDATVPLAPVAGRCGFPRLFSDVLFVRLFLLNSCSTFFRIA